MDNDKFKSIVKQEVKNVIREISTTANVAGYLTPFAFSGKSKEDEEKRKKRLKKMNKQYGYTLVNDVMTPEAMQDFYAYFSDFHDGTKRLNSKNREE